MTLYINIFGGPGVGKSTTAAKLFTKMKINGLNVELVTEVAKDFVWEDRITTLSIQPYITIKQFRNLYRLKGKVDYVITDAPILLGNMYADKYAPHLPASYKQFISDLHKQELDPSFNIMLSRVFKYDSNGRYQDETEAVELDSDIRKVLVENDIKYYDWSPDNDIDDIIHTITTKPM